jgi:hypothetical protein
VINGWHDRQLDEQVFQGLGQVVGPWLLVGGEELGGELVGLRVVDFNLFFSLGLFVSQVSQVRVREVFTVSHPVLTGLLVATVDEALHEIIVSAHARGIIGGKAGEGGEQGLGAGDPDPFGDAGVF